MELADTARVDRLLALIRPEWRAKSLVDRIQRLLPVGSSGARQTLLDQAPVWEACAYLSCESCAEEAG